MGLRFIRQPSETPNISNADDALMIRYAYGNQNGYVKGRGAELSYTIDGTKFRINSGVVVLQGYETEIDANGWELNIGIIPTTQYFSIYYEVNLATQTTAIKSVYDTTNYPSVLPGDDLTQNRTGTARLLLYQLRTNNGVFQTVTKVVQPIKYIVDYITDLTNGNITPQKAADVTTYINGKAISSIFESNGTTVKNATNVTGSISGKAISSIFESDGTTVKKATTATNYDTTTGNIRNKFLEIEQRLTNLGFRSGAVSYSSGAASVNYIYRQGNYVIGKFVWSGTTNIGTLTLPVNFRPKTAVSQKIGVTAFYTSEFQGTAQMTINTSGTITFSPNFTGSIRALDFMFGFEANPIT